MRNLVTFLTLFVAITITMGCSKQAAGVSASQADTIPGYYVPQEDTLKTVIGLQTSLDTMFKQVYKSDLSLLDIDKKFTSLDFSAAEGECVKRSDRFLRKNHWTQDLDSGTYQMKIQSISYEEPADTATAVVEIHTSRNGKIGVVTLKMVWERDNWYIDNFISSTEDAITDEKATLKHYLETGEMLKPTPKPKEDKKENTK